MMLIDGRNVAKRNTYMLRQCPRFCGVTVYIAPVVTYMLSEYKYSEIALSSYQALITVITAILGLPRRLDRRLCRSVITTADRIYEGVCLSMVFGVSVCSRLERTNTVV